MVEGSSATYFDGIVVSQRENVAVKFFELVVYDARVVTVIQVEALIPESDFGSNL